MMGNKAYYANRHLINGSQLQIYRTLVRPVVTYGSEWWTLTMEGERVLAVFERKILRKMYGPVKENSAKNIWTSERKRIMERKGIMENSTK
jgi:hypothetical protein